MKEDTDMKKATSSEAWNEEMFSYNEQGVEYAYDDELEYGYVQDGEWNTPENIEQFRKLTTKIYNKEVVESRENVRRVWKSWFRRFDEIAMKLHIKCGALLCKVTWLELECNRIA